MDFEVTPIPLGKKRGWQVKIDGQPAEDVGMIEVVSERFGTLSHGLRPEGYDGWCFRENGGGGAVTLPYTKMHSGILLVGLIEENRPNMGGAALCIIGGFINPGEKHEDAQVREAAHEAGLNSAEAAKLEGLPINSNRAFFVADPARDEGVHAYAIEIPVEYVVAGGPTDPLRYQIPEEVKAQFGKIANVQLFPVNVAIRMTADALALAAIARLIAHLS